MNVIAAIANNNRGRGTSSTLYTNNKIRVIHMQGGGREGIGNLLGAKT